MERVHLDITWASLWRILLFVVLAIILFSGRNIILGLFLAIVISSGLDQFISFLERRGLPRVLSVILIFVTGALLVAILLYGIIPLLITDIRSVITGLNKTLESLGFGSLVDSEVIQSINNFIARISVALFAGGSLNTVSQILGGVGLALSVFISSFYLSLSRDGVSRFLKVVLPTDYEDVALRIYERSRKQIGLWFQTQIVLSLMVGVLVWIALTVLGVRHAFLLAVLAAMFEIVPYIGPILSGAVAVLVALGSSPLLSLYTMLAFLVIQQLENHVLVPLLTRRAIGLHPVIVIIAILIGVEAGGFLGLVISVPAAAVFQEVIDEWSTKKKGRAA